MTCTPSALTQSLPLPKLLGKAPLEPWETRALRVNHLKMLIQCFGEGYPPSVQMPSVIALAALYDCDILSLLTSLRQLQEQAYDYRMMSLDKPLWLLDPLCRFRCRRSLLRQRRQWRSSKKYTSESQAHH